MVQPIASVLLPKRIHPISSSTVSLSGRRDLQSSVQDESWSWLHCRAAYRMSLGPGSKCRREGPVGPGLGEEGSVAREGVRVSMASGWHHLRNVPLRPLLASLGSEDAPSMSADSLSILSLGLVTMEKLAKRRLSR